MKLKRKCRDIEEVFLIAAKLYTLPCKNFDLPFPSFHNLYKSDSQSSQDILDMGEDMLNILAS